jgi:hypothetical protein
MLILVSSKRLSKVFKKLQINSKNGKKNSNSVLINC